MQNQPIITAAPSATPANSMPSIGNAAGTSAAPTAETFGSVLARQRDTSNSAEMSDATHTASIPSGDTPTGSEATDATQTAMTDLLGMLPSDMLAALLPTPINSTKTDAEGSGIRNARALEIEQDALRAQSLASDPAPAITGMTAPPMTIPAALQSIPSDQLARSAATDTPDIAALTPSAGQTAAFQSLATDRTMAANLSQAKFEITGTAQPMASSGATTPTNTALDALKSVRAEQVAGTPLATVPRSENNLLAPQPDISSGVNITPQIAAAVATQTGAPAQITVNTPVGQDTWTDDFNQSITWLATRQEQSAQLHLNPPNLGPLDVVLKVSDGQATALFTSPHAAVREAVEQALPRLREMLADSGIALGNAMVSDQSPKDQQASFAHNQLKGGANVSDKIMGMTSAMQSVESPPARRHQGMVDTFA